jgi:hypothetical protein
MSETERARMLAVLLTLPERAEALQTLRAEGAAFPSDAVMELARDLVAAASLWRFA